MKEKRHIYMTGFMGAGKSKIGLLLAEQLGRPFFDTDRMIEQETGKTVKQIFEEEGEQAFRDQETDIVRRLCQSPQPAVISLGGGALLKEENDRMVRQTGTIIYIKSSPRYILSRVKHTRKRPLLDVEEGPDFEQNLLSRIESLLGQRKALYESAHIIFDRDGLELEEILPMMLKYLQRYGIKG